MMSWLELAALAVKEGVESVVPAPIFSRVVKLLDNTMTSIRKKASYRSWPPHVPQSTELELLCLAEPEVVTTVPSTSGESDIVESAQRPRPYIPGKRFDTLQCESKKIPPEIF